jgi:hypothetical protein
MRQGDTFEETTIPSFKQGVPVAVRDGVGDTSHPNDATLRRCRSARLETPRGGV